MTDTCLRPSRSPSRRPRRASSVATYAVASVLTLGTMVSCGTDAEDATTADSNPPSASPGESTSTGPRSGPSELASSESAPTTTAPGMDPVVLAAVEDALGAGFPALVPTDAPADWTFVNCLYNDKFDGNWALDYSDPNGAPVSLVQTAQSPDELVTRLGAGAEKTAQVDLSEFGLGTWDLYEGGSQVGLIKRLPSTSALVMASDQATAEALASSLITAEDADLPEAG